MRDQWQKEVFVIADIGGDDQGGYTRVGLERALGNQPKAGQQIVTCIGGDDSKGGVAFFGTLALFINRVQPGLPLWIRWLAEIGVVELEDGKAVLL